MTTLPKQAKTMMRARAATKSAILLIDHGSRRAAANQMLWGVAALVRARLDERWIVEAAHMELAAPDIATAFSRCVAAGAASVLCVPYMLAPGRHATVDIPALVAEAASAHPGVEARCTAPLGLHRALVDIVLARCGLDASTEPSGGATLVGAACRGEPGTCAESPCLCDLGFRGQLPR